MTRRTLTRDQVLAWNSDWSFTDREIIEQNLDRLDARTFYVPPSGGYVGCIDSDATIVMTIHAGYVEFRAGLAPADRPEPDWQGLALSTFRPHASPTPEREPDEQICAIHNIAIPRTGVCDLCT